MYGSVSVQADHTALLKLLTHVNPCRHSRGSSPVFPQPTSSATPLTCRSLAAYERLLAEGHTQLYPYNSMKDCLAIKTCSSAVNPSCFAIYVCCPRALPWS